MTGIVVGVDGSKDADAALSWALREGAWRSRPVVAVVACGPDDCPDGFEPGHAVANADPGSGAHGSDDAGDRTDAERMAAAAHQVVSDALARLGDPDLTAVELVERAVAADPVVALVEASAEADVLVVGHRGGGRLRRLLAGSVSSACLHQATGPVVVVRDSVLPAGDQGPVLVGVDGSDASIAALRWAAEAARVRFTSLRVLHSWSPVPPVYTGFY
nr:universal stress protein [Micromonospora sp. DSM 115978]